MRLDAIKNGFIPKRVNVKTFETNATARGSARALVVLQNIQFVNPNELTFRFFSSLSESFRTLYGTSDTRVISGPVDSLDLHTE